MLSAFPYFNLILNFVLVFPTVLYRYLPEHTFWDLSSFPEGLDLFLHLSIFIYCHYRPSTNSAKLSFRYFFLRSVCSHSPVWVPWGLISSFFNGAPSLLSTSIHSCMLVLLIPYTTAQHDHRLVKWQHYFSKPKLTLIFHSWSTSWRGSTFL